MTEKHYPYCGGSFDRIIFDKDGSVWVPETDNAKLRELVKHLRECTRHNVCAACEYADDVCDFDYDMRKLGIEVDA